jgi:hypothetical protein
VEDELEEYIPSCFMAFASSLLPMNRQCIQAYFAYQDREKEEKKKRE